MRLASDVDNPDFAGAMNPDSVLHVTFYQKAVKNEYQSREQNRPIFFDCDYIRIEKPGDTLSIIDTPAREDHKQRFPIQWARYQNSKEADQTIGTPIDEWPLLTQAQRETLKALNFRTVDGIANASDAQIQAVGMAAGMSPMAFRERAKSYLLRASEEASKSHSSEELVKLQEQNAELQRQLQALMADMAEVKARRGRPPKDASSDSKETVNDTP